MLLSKYYGKTRSTTPLRARFMGLIWGPPGADRTQVCPVLAPWTLLSETATDFVASCVTGSSAAMMLTMLDKQASVSYENGFGCIHHLCRDREGEYSVGFLKQFRRQTVIGACCLICLPRQHNDTWMFAKNRVFNPSIESNTKETRCHTCSMNEHARLCSIYLEASILIWINNYTR